MYNKSPDPLFISGEARPLVNETPNATRLLLVSVAIPRLNDVSIVALPPVKDTGWLVASKSNLVPELVMPKTSVWSFLFPKNNDLSWKYFKMFVSASYEAI